MRLDVLRLRDFRLFFMGQAVSDFGDKLVPVALAFAVLEQTNSASVLGLVLASRTIPNVVFLLAGGVWADRLRRQRLMQATNVVRGVTQVVLAALFITGSSEVWQICALAAIYGTADAFFGPAATGLVPELVPTDRLQEANGLMSLSRSTLGILAPAIAGVLVATVGAGWAIGLDGITFWISAATLARLRTADRSVVRTKFLHELATGWREVTSRTWIWACIVSFSLFHLLVLGPFFVLAPVIARESLGGSSAYAAIVAAAGVGSVLGGLMAIRFRPRRPLLAAVCGFAIWGVEVAAYALTLPVPVIAAAAILAAMFMNFGNALWFTALQQHVPREAISRVSSYDWMGSLVFLPIGYALAGPAADAVGSEFVLLFAAGATFAMYGALALLPSVRDLGGAGPAAGRS